MTDEELMLAYQNGNMHAFESLYQNHSGKVYGYLKTALKTPEAADDAFQAVFLKLHQSRMQYDASMPFLPWLFTICRTTVLDTHRKRKAHPEDAVTADKIENLSTKAQLAQSVAPESPSLSEKIDFKLLSKTQREAIKLRYEDDLSFEDIAKKIKNTPAGVRQLISRAVRKLREQS